MTVSRIFKHHFVSLRRIATTNIFFRLMLSLFIMIAIFIFMRWMETPAMARECLSELNRKSKILAEIKVHVLPSDPKVSQPEHVMEKRRISTQKGIECVDMSLPDHSEKYKMCIYDPNKDLVISKNIKMFGSWEKENVAEMLKAFQMFPDLVLVDLGSNIGAFTLPAAVSGAEVIAVDALKENHVLLQHSMAENSLSCQVTLIHNAIYSKRGQMKIAVNPRNIGGSVIMNIPDFRSNSIHESDRVDAICLDDLIPIVNGKNVFLKMDIEGSEEAAFECADQFFKQNNVKVLLIEWINYRHNEKSTSNIKTFLESHRMVPTWGVDRNHVIDLSASDSWPANVFWMEN